MGGGAFVRTTPLHAETIAAEARARQATCVASVPAHLRGVAAARRPGALPPLRRMFSSGAPLDAATARDVAARRWNARDRGARLVGDRRDRLARGARRPRLAAVRRGSRSRADAEGRMLVRSPFVAAGRGRRVGRSPGRGSNRRPPRRTVSIFSGAPTAWSRSAAAGSRSREIERLLREIPGVADAAVIAVDTPGAAAARALAAVVAPGLDVRGACAARRSCGGSSRSPCRAGSASSRRSRARTTASWSARACSRCSTSAGPSADPCALHVPADWQYFRGHFDDFPILAGVVQLHEIVLREVHERWSELRRLRRITGLKFRKPIAPGDELALELGAHPRAGQGELACAARRRGTLRGRVASACPRVRGAPAARRTGPPRRARPSHERFARPCAVIPTFDNPLTIARVVADVRRHVDDVLVVDDGSGDEGRRVVEAIAKAGAGPRRPPRAQRRQGRGGEDRAARRARARVLARAADRRRRTARSPGDIPRFLARAAEQPEAAVLGHPVWDETMPPRPARRPRAHQLLVFVETAGRHIVDPQCGFRVYPLEPTLAVRRRGDRMDFDIEIAVRLVLGRRPDRQRPDRRALLAARRRRHLALSAGPR